MTPEEAQAKLDKLPDALGNPPSFWAQAAYCNNAMFWGECS